MTIPKGKHPKGRTERRKQPRDPGVAPDWEQIVLQRVANHVRSLPDHPSPDTEGSASSGWEDAALQQLKKRILDLDSDR